MPGKNEKRHLKVIGREKEMGCVEYKRQVSSSNPDRLRSLMTQMSFRMDEGRDGVCVYQVGVEDDGCHSLLDYPAVNKSCLILEYLAHRLNAVVVERIMYQNEVKYCQETSQYVLCSNENDNNHQPIVFSEPSVLGDAMGNGTPFPKQENGVFPKQENGESQEEEEQRRRRQPGVLTRAQLKIQRIETHTLAEPPPLILDDDDDDDDDNENVDKEEEAEVTFFSAAAPARTNSNNNNNNNNKEPANISTTTRQQPIVALPKRQPPNASAAAQSNIGDTLSFRNIRIAVMGNVDAGKSTLIGTLTTSSLDDGRGKTRTFVMRHRHEIETGRTSTVSQHLMGFSAKGEPILGRDTVRSKIKGMDEIAKEAYKVVTFMDLAGHEKFFKTTVHGVSSGFADYALVLVNSRHPPTHMTHRHLSLCNSFNIPIVVVFTKVDGCPKHAMDISYNQVVQMLQQAPECNKKLQPLPVKTTQDVAECVNKLANHNTGNSTVVPMFYISSVTGEGIDLLQKLFFSLPKRRRHANKTKRKFEFLVEEVFEVPNVGAVVAGFVNAGELSVGTTVQIGPMDDGSFLRVLAKSAHIARIPATHITAGQSATLALQMASDLHGHHHHHHKPKVSLAQTLRRGMAVLKEDFPCATKQFEAEILVLKGQKSVIKEPHQAFVHVLNVRQVAVARNIELLVKQHMSGSNGRSKSEGRPPLPKIVADSCNADQKTAVAVTTDDAAISYSAQSKEGTETSKDVNEARVLLAPGSRAKVRFEFMLRPEYVRKGMRVLFRDGRVRGVGIVTLVPRGVYSQDEQIH